MAKLIYSVIVSLDGHVVDADGNFDWAAPGEQVHAFVNDRERSIGTYLYGRRLYEVMRVWEELDDDHPVMRDYADIWRAADKIVYSTSLDRVDIPRTRLERTFDAAAVRRLVDEADRDVSIGGPTLAATALRAGIVDELQVFQTPHVVGGGINYLPGGVRLELDLVDHRRFDDGVIYLHYRTSRGAAS